MKNLLIVAVFLTALCASPFINQAHAALGYGGEAQLQTFFDGTSGFLVKTIGTGVFLIGLVIAGIKISAGDQGGLRNAVMVMVGGAIIFLAKPIVGVLASFAGTR